MEIFLDLDDHALQLFMRNIVASLGGNYVVVWTLDRNTRELACRDGWYNPGMEAGSSSMTESVGLRLFNLYRLSRFALGIGVPALAFDTGTFIWLNSNEILNFCCNDEQRNFYIVADIKTAIFIPCGNGVIELGMTNLITPNEDLQMQISNFVATFMTVVPISRQTSPSSSLPSQSIDSPESSSFTTATSTTMTIPSSTITREQINVPPFPLQSVLPFLQPFLPSYQIPTTQSEYTPQPRIIPPHMPRMPPRQPFSQLASRPGAFGTWRAGGMVPPRGTGGGHMRFKRSVELLKHIHAQRIGQFEASTAGRPTTPLISSSQLHHMISERKRREKLRESFDALRSLLPPGSRKDKASILVKTREYLSTLNSRVQELQTANQRLESLVRANERTGEGGVNVPEATAVTIEEEDESIQSDELGLRIRVTNPSNSIDVIISILNTLRERGIDMISLNSQSEIAAATQLTVRLNIRLAEETRRDPARREEIKQGIQRALERRPHN